MALADAEPCWSCGKITQMGIICFTCDDCDVKWYPIRHDLSKEELQEYYDRRSKQVEYVSGLSLVDHTQPGTAHP